MADCIFCKIVNKEVLSEIVFEDDKLIAFKDINPKADLHILIVPKQHIESIEELQDKELAADLIFAAKEISKSFEIARSGYKLIFNVKAGGGQLINHIHLHLLAGNKFQLP